MGRLCQSITGRLKRERNILRREKRRLRLRSIKNNYGSYLRAEVMRRSSVPVPESSVISSLKYPDSINSLRQNWTTQNKTLVETQRLTNQGERMAVKVQPVQDDDIMEVDLTTEATSADRLPIMNGNFKHIPAKIELILEDPDICRVDIKDFILKCSNSIFKSYKGSLDVQVEDLSQTVRNAQGIVEQTNDVATKLNTLFSEKMSLFKTSVNGNLKTYSRNIVNVQTKPAAATVVRKEQGDGLEILNTISSVVKANLPPVGELVRSPLEIGTRVWAMKTNLLNVWVKGTVSMIKPAQSGSEKLYKVRLDFQKYVGHKSLPAKHLAYENPSTVIIPVGTRIIARYTDSAGRSAHYAGIIAEPPKVTNHKRYLIFFDDGCAQYVKHEDLYVVAAQSVDVADDVHENISDFVRSYLHQYPERPMVKLLVNQCVKTEYNFEWSDAKVLEVDCSMVKMLFLTSQRVEWIYRGSTRLKPLRNELANAEAHRLEGKNRRRHNIPRKPHQPYIEYTREDVVVLDSDSDEDKSSGVEEIKTNKPKNTARKSLATRPFTTSLNVKSNPIFRVTDKKSHLGYKDTSRIKSFVRIPFHNHDCGMHCREREHPVKHRGKNPLLIPILLGWERQLRKYRVAGPGAKQVVTYRSSCGRQLRNLEDIQNYLYLVKSELTIDLFSFDPNLNIFRSFRPKEVLYKDDDITQGKENVPVSCVNSLSDEPPPYVEYSAERFPGEGVYLNLDPEFLCGCNCTDNCQNPATCLCQQITNYARYGKTVGDAGYKFSRLREPVVTGIYECNSRCKCNSQCGNRVVQNGLTVRLQMFKTQYKGWGIRCLDDIDAGQFVCVYAGQLLTEQGADQDGKECGDEYLAELDHIEVVEKTKEGYESDVPEMSMDIDTENKIKVKKEDNDNPSSDDHFGISSDSDVDVLFDSDSEFESSLRSTATSTYATRSRQRKRKKGSNSSESNEDSNSGTFDSNKKDEGLPDIETNLEKFRINPRPPSPESAEVLEKIELKRKPKISENGVTQKVVAKKSVSMKKPLSSLEYDHKEYKFKSVRCYFGEDSLYIMDAKSKGNIGRYLNHSCEPNVFVQNVFVDTHDLRFPAVAFFAHDSIDAGTELTWDYNYEVGSVADKVMYCYCEAPSCRGRLL